MSNHMRVFICTGLGLAILSCKHNSVGPDGGNSADFSLRLSVVNATGLPVKGLQVSAFNNANPVPSALSDMQKESPRSINAVTTVDFAAPVRAHVSLMALNMDGSPVSTLMNQNIPNAGLYAIIFSVPRTYGTRVYKLLLVATDSAATIISRDSIYAVQWNIDPSLGIIGYTSSAGTFQTQDSLLFPNVLSLPTLILTNASSPDQVGTFRIPDTVIVVLNDTLSRQSQSYACNVGSGSNDIHLVWNPSPENQPARVTPRVEVPLLVPLPGPGPARSPSVWQLYQNYPNPFN